VTKISRRRGVRPVGAGRRSVAAGLEFRCFGCLNTLLKAAALFR